MTGSSATSKIDTEGGCINEVDGWRNDRRDVSEISNRTRINNTLSEQPTRLGDEVSS